jgi:hypothetical protein
MADIELVIKIPKQVYNYIHKHHHIANSDILDIKDAIINGTPLPKGHGRLIDADKFDVISYQHTSDDFDNGVMWLAEQISGAQTIIEADKESEDDKQ